MTVEERLATRGWTLPEATTPPARFVPAVGTDNLVFLSGVIAIANGSPIHRGKVGADLTLEEGMEAARLTAMTALANLRSHLGSLERVKRVVHMNGYVVCNSDFYESYKVIDGASEVLNVAFGEKGQHARTSMGVISLSLNASLELDMVVEVVADSV